MGIVLRCETKEKKSVSLSKKLVSKSALKQDLTIGDIFVYIYINIQIC